MIPGVEHYHPREDWQEPGYEISGPATPWPDIDTGVVHYTAAGTTPSGDDPDEVAAYLRSMQRDYVDNRGYSVGYWFAVDRARGAVWQLRGWEYKSAANRGENDHTGPVLVLVNGANPATDVQADSVRAINRETEQRARRPIVVVGHQEIGATACPGAGLQTQTDAGLFDPDHQQQRPPAPEPEPEPEPEPQPEEHPTMIRLAWTNDNDVDTEIVTTGAALSWKQDGDAAAPYVRAGVPVERVSTAELLADIRSSVTTGPAPWTFTDELADAWNLQAR